MAKIAQSKNCNAHVWSGGRCAHCPREQGLKRFATKIMTKGQVVAAERRYRTIAGAHDAHNRLVARLRRKSGLGWKPTANVVGKL